MAPEKGALQNSVTCSLCGKTITDYDPAAHHLVLSEEQTAEICSRCCRIFVKWQQERLTLLFPTKAARRRQSRSDWRDPPESAE